jgi:hypothetical protein
MYCKYCGKKQDSDAVFCSSCGAELSTQIAPIPSSGQNVTSGTQKKKKPRVSFGPNSRNLTEYQDVDYEEAQRVWSTFSTWERRMWNEAGRPDLLTFAGAGFPEWIIDNADDGFDFHRFVDDWGARQRELPAVAPPQAQPLRGPGGNKSVQGPKNKIAIPALVLGIASVFLFETVVVPIASIVVGGISLRRALQLKRLGVKESGLGFSLAGLILGIIYTFAVLVLAAGLV